MKLSKVYAKAAKKVLEPYFNWGTCVAVGDLVNKDPDCYEAQLVSRYFEPDDAKSLYYFGPTNLDYYYTNEEIIEAYEHRATALLLLSEIVKDEERKRTPKVRGALPPKAAKALKAKMRKAKQSSKASGASRV